MNLFYLAKTGNLETINNSKTIITFGPANIDKLDDLEQQEGTSRIAKFMQNSGN